MRRTLFAGACEQHLVEIREWDDQPHVVFLHERPQRREVARVVDPRYKGMRVGLVESRRERVGVGGDRRGAGALECADDVHALPRTRKENRRHGGQYSRNGRLASAEAAMTAAAATRQRPGRRSTA